MKANKLPKRTAKLCGHCGVWLEDFIVIVVPDGPCDKCYWELSQIQMEEYYNDISYYYY